MSNITIKKGSIFDSLYLKEVQTIVNTVNCVGVMGKGIALAYKLFYPEMFSKYEDLCRSGQMAIGKLWIYKSPEGLQPWVLNFPTKADWKAPSKLQFIELGLQKFVATYKEKGITSIAFPMLGTANGGLDHDTVLEMMKHYLSQCDIPVTIYLYSTDTPDLYCELFKSKWSSLSPEEKKKYVKTQNRIDTLDQAIASNQLTSLLDLIKLRGIGGKTLEACFHKVLTHTPSNSLQLEGLNSGKEGLC